MASMTTAGTFAGVQTISESMITEPLVLYPDLLLLPHHLPAFRQYPPLFRPPVLHGAVIGIANHDKQTFP